VAAAGRGSDQKWRPLLLGDWPASLMALSVPYKTHVKKERRRSLRDVCVEHAAGLGSVVVAGGWHGLPNSGCHRSRQT
jgi:hypothetical protein